MNANALLDELLDAAQQARSHAYAPYSKFSVGAALRCADGSIVTGCNVENASYGLSMCAERAAIVSAIAQGKRQFVAIAIAGPDHSMTAPCGACRQVMVEFNPEMEVRFTTPDVPRDVIVSDLLPAYFGPHALL